jgi:serine/threonine protein kinase
VLHRDIKPANVLVFLTFGGGIMWKLDDVGIAKVLQGTVHADTHVGVPMYMAPDALLGPYDSKVDVFSTGIMAAELVVRHMDIPGFERAAHRAYQLPERRSAMVEDACGRLNTVSPALSSVVRRCCAMTAADRLTSLDAMRALEAIVMDENVLDMPRMAPPTPAGEVPVSAVAHAWLTVDWSDAGLLGQGAFADVRAAVFRGERCAVKLFKSFGREHQRESLNAAMTAEADAIRAVDHASVVRLLEVVLDPTAADSHGKLVAPCIVMERLPGSGSLQRVMNTSARSDPLRPLFDALSPVSAKLQVLRLIADGLRAIHDRGMTHGDIKCENVVVAWDGDEWHVRIVDFGLAGPAGRGRGGTIPFQAPELMQGYD